MNEQDLKMMDKHIKCQIVKWENDIKPFEIKYVRKNTFWTVNVQNVLGVLLITILKFRSNRFYKNMNSKNCRILNFFRYIVLLFLEKKSKLIIHLKI